MSTVREWIEALGELPGHAEVYVSRDPEGNGFNSTDITELSVDVKSEGKPAVVIWSAYPQHVELDFPDDEEDS